MIDLIKNQWVGIIAVVLVVISMASAGTESLVGASATTVTNPWTFAESTGTTTITVQSTTAGKGACLALELNDGSGYGYFSVSPDGNWATSSATCN